MEGAEPNEVLPALLQLDECTDEIDDVGRIAHLIDFFLWNAHNWGDKFQNLG